MNRVAHVTTSAANHKALLCVSIHAKDQTKTHTGQKVEAKRGLIIAMLCPPSPTETKGTADE